MHARLREHSLQAWEEIRPGKPNPLADQICRDQAFLAFLTEEQLRSLMDVGAYVGDAPQRARALASKIKKSLRH
jgi:adenylosuccinate lyase